ncbi:MAG TPA: choice-of-anchor D domain-containing protein [Terriglobales bacterium]|nr:choice-of-anchor D domain-containing protein [Terriglobales bacterium]
MRLPQPSHSLSISHSIAVLATALVFFTSVTAVAAHGQRSQGSQGKVQLSANPSTLNFGNVQVGSTATLTDTLTNVGKDNLTIYNDQITGSGFTMDGLALPVTLTPGQSYTLTLNFSPSSSGSASGTASFGSLNWKKQLNVSLSGSGAAAGQLTVSPGTEDFGNVNVGTSASLNGTITASGQSVTISSANSSNGQFALNGLTFPLTLSAGSSANFTVMFTPQSAGSITGTISFSNTAPGSPVVEALGGNGVVVQHSVNLAWNASTSAVAGYNVYRGNVSGGPYSKINPSLDSSTAYADSSVSSGTTYYYVTTAVDSQGTESAYSNQVQAVIP